MLVDEGHQLDGEQQQPDGRETVDDAKITTIVKAELAKEKMRTLTKVDVDTNRGTVYLNGTVPDETTRAHATDIARRVAGVRDVVNNLRVQ